jgi:phage protein D
LTFDRSSPRHPWSNALAVTFRRSMTVSRDVFVDVRSHSLFEGSSRKTARAFLGKRPATRGGTAQVYSYLLEDATEEEAQLFAERMLRRITATQISMNARIPGDARVDAATRVVVTGTNSSFDQDFYIDHLIHRFGAQRGYEVEIQAKNHLTQSTVQG